MNHLTIIPDLTAKAMLTQLALDLFDILTHHPRSVTVILPYEYNEIQPWLLEVFQGDDRAAVLAVEQRIDGTVIKLGCVNQEELCYTQVNIQSNGLLQDLIPECENTHAGDYKFYFTTKDTWNNRLTTTFLHDVHDAFAYKEATLHIYTLGKIPDLRPEAFPYSAHVRPLPLKADVIIF